MKVIEHTGKRSSIDRVFVLEKVKNENYIITNFSFPAGVCGGGSHSYKTMQVGEDGVRHTLSNCRDGIYLQ